MKNVVLASLLILSLVTSAGAEIVPFGSGVNQFTMEFVPIGNPGNPADTTGSPNPAGSVAYNYNMGKYEISRDMVTKANAAGNLGITLEDMSFLGGNGVNRPATGVSWNEAARFVNWLNTSQGYSPAYKFTTQPGGVGYSADAHIVLWNSGDAGFNAANQFRNSLARYFLPSADEWYKAAYYNPNTGTYVNYPTGSDSAPTAVGSGTTAGTAVYNQFVDLGPADVALAGGLSFYGTMAQGGNVQEWEETEFDLVNNSPFSSRGIRGGYWEDSSSFLLSSVRLGTGPLDDIYYIGFRVASASSVPEASPALIGALISLSVLAWRRTAG
jgi:formylglycine-generating enzyme required for sulfatase activity